MVGSTRSGADAGTSKGDAEVLRLLSLDNLYVTPPFHIKIFSDSEKLYGHRNFKAWKAMIELDLRALNLSPFIEECGMSIQVSPVKRVVLDGQTVQYLRASVSKSVTYSSVFNVKRIFLYVKNTRTCGLLYGQGSRVLDAYVDADHAGDPRTRKSTTGYLIRYYGNTIGWGSRLQQCSAKSFGEAEYVSICESMRNILFVARLSQETIGDVEYPIIIHEDNTAVVSISNSETSNSRVKHIEQSGNVNCYV